MAFFYLLFAIFVHGAYDLTLLVPGFPAAIPILIALLRTSHRDEGAMGFY